MYNLYSVFLFLIFGFGGFKHVLLQAIEWTDGVFVFFLHLSGCLWVKTGATLTHHPRNMALLRAKRPIDKALLNPYFWWGYVRGGLYRLTSHET